MGRRVVQDKYVDQRLSQLPKWVFRISKPCLLIWAHSRYYVVLHSRLKNYISAGLSASGNRALLKHPSVSYVLEQKSILKRDRVFSTPTQWSLQLTMPGYTSDDFHRDWVYACSTQDFKSSGGQPASWAPGQSYQWGDENAKIPLPSQPETASLYADSTLLAVSLENDVHIFTISDLSLHQALKGHVSRIDAMSFHPEESKTLVSCAMHNSNGA